jgi:hypothetical protein
MAPRAVAFGGGVTSDPVRHSGRAFSYLGAGVVSGGSAHGPAMIAGIAEAARPLDDMVADSLRWTV